MEGFTWLYIIWSIVPIGIAVLFSFNKGASQSTWQGFSTKWYVGSSVNSVLHNTALHQAVIQTLVLAVLTTLICVPIGVGFAIGIDRWRSRTSTSLNFVMIFSFVIPELLLAVALFMLVTQALTFIGLGTEAEVAGLVSGTSAGPRSSSGRAWSYRAKLRRGRDRPGIVTARGDPSRAAAAADAGGLRKRSARVRSTVDDFVIVEQLSSTAATQPMSVVIYANVHGGLSGPALNALATIMLLFSVVAALVGLVAYRWMTRGERAEDSVEALTTIAGM